MWICPKCGREFKRTNQEHYCGKAPETVQEYIELQPSEPHSHLKGLMNAIRDNVPHVHECILWSMPYYKKEKKQSPLLLLKSMLVFMSVLKSLKNFHPN